VRAAGTSAASISRTPRLPSRRKRRILMGCETNDTVDRGEQGARTRSCGTWLDWLTVIPHDAGASTSRQIFRKRLSATFPTPQKNGAIGEDTDGAARE